MKLSQSFFLGAVQGITEFLPISSSGHLVLFQNLFGLQEPEILFDTALHCGTLAAVFFVFYKDIAHLAATAFSLFSIEKIKKLPRRYREESNVRFLVLIAAGTLPTLFLGAFFKDFFESMFSSVPIVGGMLLVTGLLLWLTRLFGSSSKNILEMSIIHALIIGLVQGLAITPGISRSGSTIACALYLGIERETAARYSFLLSVPAILGATALNFFSHPLDNSAVMPLASGTIAATVVGLIALKFLIQTVKKGRFHLFAPYCWIVGAVIIALSFRG